MIRTEVPPALTEATIAREGDAGRTWIESLPRTVESLCRRWNLVPDGPVMHGYTALVVPVRRESKAGEAGGHSVERCVLKVRWLDESTQHEGLALRAWEGRGAVRLLDEHVEQGALLLERLDASRSLADVDEAEAVRVAARLLRRLAVPAPPGAPDLHGEVDRMRAELLRTRDRVGGPISRARLLSVLDLATDLAADGEGRLVNYDLHYENVLGAEREPWLAIDPKVVAGDPSYGVAQLLWNRAGEMTRREDLDRRLKIIVDVARLDPRRARAWSIVRLVEYWTWARGIGQPENGVCPRLLSWLGWES